MKFKIHISSFTYRNIDPFLRDSKLVLQFPR